MTRLCHVFYLDADIAVADDEGYTPLLAAVSNGYTNICQWLYEKKADLDVTENQDLSPMLVRVLLCIDV